MRKLILALGLWMAHTAFAAAVYPPTHQDALRAVAIASQASDHPLLRHTWRRHNDFHVANQVEINHIIAEISRTDQTAEALQAAVKAALESDLAAVKDFNATFKDLPKPTDDDSKEEKERKTVLPQFTAHKLVEGLTGALKLVQDPEAMGKIKGGALPDGYNINLDDEGIVFTAGRDSIFGNEQARSFKTLLVRTLLAVMDKSSMADLEEVMSPLYPKDGWLRSSAMGHLIPIPHYANVGLISGTPYLCEIAGKLYLGHPNSAYEFGGHRQEYALYPTPKWNGPQDCSSGVAELLGMNPRVMLACTFHYYWVHRWMNGDAATVDKGIARAKSTHAIEDPILEELTTLLSPVDIADLRVEYDKKLQPGDVYMYRNFKLAVDSARTFGDGGHGVVILGFLPPAESDGYPSIVGYEWNRALERGLDGRGVVERLFLPASDTHYPMFFRPTDEAHRRIAGLLVGSATAGGAGASS